MKTGTWHAVLVIIGLAGLVVCPCASADETSADVSPTNILHPSELWPMPEDNGYEDLLAAIQLLPDPGALVADFLYVRANNLNYTLYSAGPNKVDDGGVQKGRSWTREDPDVVIVNTLAQYPENQRPEGGPVPAPAPAPQ